MKKSVHSSKSEKNQNASSSGEKIAKRTKKTTSKSVKTKKVEEISTSNVSASDDSVDDESNVKTSKKSVVNEGTRTPARKSEENSSKLPTTAKSVKSDKITTTISKRSSRRKTETSDSASKDAASSDERNFDWLGVKEAIDKVSLSDDEQNRRAKATEYKKRAPKSGVEKFYSGKLPAWEPGWIIVQGARQHNLKSIDVPFPLSAFTVVTGVSGSGKSSLVEDVLYGSLASMASRATKRFIGCDQIVGAEKIKKVARVDQSPIGQSPTSNPATYTGLFDMIRTLYAQTAEAKMRGFTPRRFSFNVPGGRCEKCEGAGQLKVEMLFLADVWITCDACGGKRYDEETLKVKFRGKSIADTLETTCGDALKLFGDIPPMRRILQTLCDVGLDYIPLGQSSTTLSGGEAQRVKMAAELSRIDSGQTLYILDEPTTGLHFSDVSKLLEVIHRLVDLGNTVVVVEHNLDVVKNADWIIDVGPDAGLEGGRLVFAGTPEQLLQYVVERRASLGSKNCGLRSYTGESLFPVFENGSFVERTVLDPARYWEQVKEETSVGKTDESVALAPNSPAPWEIDGRRWHLELRTNRQGAQCRWDPKILVAITDRLEDSQFFADADWNSRASVEVRANDKNATWFFRAATSEEWLLKLRFRTAKNTFNKDLLSKSLGLKPLNEIDEIPLYGTQSRVKVDSFGAWQEIEMKVFSFEEIDSEEFWDFLSLAIERFEAQLAHDREDVDELTPWKSQGREWHFSDEGIYGTDSGKTWSHKTLAKIIDLFEETAIHDKTVWNQKIAVEFLDKAERLWARVYTKNSDYICAQVNIAKGKLRSSGLETTSFDAEIDESDESVDSIYIRWRNDESFDSKTLREFLRQIARIK